MNQSANAAPPYAILDPALAAPTAAQVAAKAATQAAIDRELIFKEKNKSIDNISSNFVKMFETKNYTVFDGNRSNFSVYAENMRTVADSLRISFVMEGAYAPIPGGFHERRFISGVREVFFSVLKLTSSETAINSIEPLCASFNNILCDPPGHDGAAAWKTLEKIYGGVTSSNRSSAMKKFNRLILVQGKSNPTHMLSIVAKLYRKANESMSGSGESLPLSLLTLKIIENLIGNDLYEVVTS